MKIVTELQKAIEEGYTVVCDFAEGCVFYCSEPHKSFFISQVTISPRPCLETQTIVYRIKFPDGVKGVALIDFQEDDCSLY